MTITGLRNRVAPVRIWYLLKESLLIIAFIYILLVGGTYVGTVNFQLLLFSAVAAGIGAAGWVIWLLWRAWRRPAALGTPLDLPLLTWLLVTGLACFFSTNSRLSWEDFARNLVLVLLFYLFISLIRSGWAEELWVKVLLITGGVVILFGVYELVSWYSPWFQIGGWADPFPPATYRVHSTLGHPNIFAAYLNLLLPLGLARLTDARKRFNQVILSAEIILILGLVFFTSSRGGWLGTAAAIGMFLFLIGLDRRAQVRQKLGWLISHKMVLGGLILAGLAVSVLGAALLLRQVQNPSHPGLSNPADARNYIWAVAFNMFDQRPLLGIGPGTFGIEFIRTYSYPPGMLLAHAHNYLFTSLGEQGLLGAAAILLLAGVIVWAIVRRWRSELASQRTMLIGVTASLTGLMVHSQFENPQMVLLINIIVAVLLAILMSPLKQSFLQANRRIASALMIVGCLVAAGMNVFYMRATALYSQGVDASYRQDWGEASRLIDAALQLDPGLAFYHFQDGLAHGILALAPDGSVQAPEELTKAIAAYKSGMAIEDGNALNWENLGSLYWAAGDQAGALVAFKHAANLAPDESVFQFKLGQLCEEMGLVETARSAYQRAVELDPGLAGDEFFKATALRQDALPVLPGITGGWAQLSAGDYVGAEQTFRKELGLNNAEPYRGLGLALAGQARYNEAVKALRTAEFIDGGSDEIKLALSKVYVQMGKNEEAQKIFPGTQVVSVQPYSTLSVLAGEGDYAVSIYHREALPVDLLK